MKNHYSTLIAIVVVALVGLFTPGRVEAVDVTLTDLQKQLKAIQSQLEKIPPAWSQNLPAPKRFVLVLGGAAVLDKETGLVWEQSPARNQRTWVGAQVFCNDRAVGGRKGWGLPTIQQLTSLVDPAQNNPALPAGHPFSDVQPDDYWSATTSASVASEAVALFVPNGDLASTSKEASTNFVWCVRGEQGGPVVR